MLNKQVLAVGVHESVGEQAVDFTVVRYGRRPEHQSIKQGAIAERGERYETGNGDDAKRDEHVDSRFNEPLTNAIDAAAADRAISW